MTIFNGFDVEAYGKKLLAVTPEDIKDAARTVRLEINYSQSPVFTPNTRLTIEWATLTGAAITIPPVTDGRKAQILVQFLQRIAVLADRNQSYMAIPVIDEKVRVVTEEAAKHFIWCYPDFVEDFLVCQQEQVRLKPIAVA